MEVLGGTQEVKGDRGPVPVTGEKTRYRGGRIDRNDKRCEREGWVVDTVLTRKVFDYLTK